jgi:hypothetical protein
MKDSGGGGCLVTFISGLFMIVMVGALLGGCVSLFDSAATP